MDGTLRNIISTLSNTEYKKMVKDIIKAINIMHTNGYYHCDIHDENIMYKKTGNKYKWYVIDYGLVYHKNINQMILTYWLIKKILKMIRLLLFIRYLLIQ